MSRFKEFVDSFPWVEAADIPWTPFNRRLSDSKTAIISTGGIYVHGDEPFAIANREDVDESYREIPVNTPTSQLRLAHEHYNKDHAEQDINSVFPVQRIKQLVQEGFLAAASEIHFSITGYIPQPRRLYDSGKEIGRKLKDMEVDIALIVPV